MKVGDLVKYKCTFSRYSGQIGLVIEMFGEDALVHWPDDNDDVRGQWYPHWHLWIVNENK